MKVNIRADSVEIEGYVNAVERNSRPLMSRMGRFIERIAAGAFKKALTRASDVKLLLNHRKDRELGSTVRGNLRLSEDNIGLHARATITDKDVIEDARNGNIVGWSFGFYPRAAQDGVEEGLPLRKILDLDLVEVSLINRAMTPCYEGTLVQVRSDDGEEKEEVMYRADNFMDDTISSSVEKSVGNSNENERATEEITTEPENQEAKDPVVEKPVEKNVKMRYNKAINIIKKMKED